MVQRGKELGYTMSTEQFKSIVENIKKENKIESQEAFEAGAQAGRHDDGRPAAAAREHMLVQRVQQTEIMQKLQVTDTELKAYYDAHRTNSPPRRRSRCARSPMAVPVTAQGVNVAADDAAKAKAEDVRSKRCRRRAVCAAGGRLFRLGVEGQRRAGRSAQQERSVRRTAAAPSRA